MRYYADQPDMTENPSPYQIGGKEILIKESDNHILTPLQLEFFVPGPARAKQSFRYTGHGHGFTPARVKAWQADVGWAAQQAIHKGGFDFFPIKSDVAVDLIFFLGTNRRIDADNLSKAVLDALNGIVWEDDKQTIDLHPHKFIVSSEESGVYVIVRKAVPDLDLLEEIRSRIQTFKKESES